MRVQGTKRDKDQCYSRITGILPQRFKDQINKSKLSFIGCIFKLDFSALDTLTLTIAHIPIFF